MMLAQWGDRAVSAIVYWLKISQQPQASEVLWLFELVEIQQG